MVSVIQAWGLASLFAVFVPTAAWPWALKREANNAIPTEDVGATVTIHPFSLDSTSLSQVVESLESVLSTLPASLYSEGASDVLGLTTAVTFTIAATLSSPEPEVSTSFVTVTTESTVTETQNAASVLSAALQTFTTTTIAVASQPTSPPSSAVLAPPPPSAAASSSPTSTTTITITSTTTAADTTTSTPNALSVLSAALATFPPSPHPTTTYTSFAPPPLPERPLPSSSTDDADIYPALSLLTTVTQTITLSDTSTGTLTFTSASTGVSTWTSAFPISTRTVTYASPRPESGSVGAGAGTSEVSVWGSVVESLDRSVSAATASATASATGTGVSGAGTSAGASASGGGGGGGGGGDGDGAAASSTAAAATGAGVSVGREGGFGGLVMAVAGFVVGVVEVVGL